MRRSIFILWMVFAAVLVSCSNPSLQKYMVEKQDDAKFVKMDISGSLLQNSSSMDIAQKETLKTIRKINVLAYPIQDNDTINFEKEKLAISNILQSDTYKTLVYMNSPDRKASLKYTGEEDAIDELIIYGSDDSQGFAVLRIIGDNMRPDDMYQLMRTIQNGDIDISQFPGFEKTFKD